jgi:hypothetical protein
VYRTRDPEASPFFTLVRDYFDQFEQVYPERFQKQYGYWRPVIRDSIDKFVKCGDLKEGFARVRCPECGTEFFVAFSCRQRCCCPSCDQKRSLLLGHRLIDEIFADVPHRQWVFTMPKRLRILFRYDRQLFGALCRLAYESICEVMQQASGNDDAVPGMVGATQTFGDLAHFHPHVHAIVSDGVFTKDGDFIPVPEVDLTRCVILWRKKVFDLLLQKKKITEEIVDSMCQWSHSGFSIDNSVRIEADDQVDLQRLTEYIVRCPFSLARMIKVTEDGKVIYRTGKSTCLRFPEHGDDQLKAGTLRNFQVFDPLEFLAEVTQHIPEKGQHQILYFGYYSNKQRGMRKKKKDLEALERKPIETICEIDETDSDFAKKRRMTWAALIKSVYEVDPLECPNCGGRMKIISFIEKCQPVVIEKILKHCGMWKETVQRPPPPKEPAMIKEPSLDYEFFDRVCI